MFGIGSWELIVILVLALVLLGPKKLPEVAKSLGKGLAQLRHSLEEVKDEIGLDDVKQEISKVKSEMGLDQIKAEIENGVGRDLLGAGSDYSASNSGVGPGAGDHLLTAPPPLDDLKPALEARGHIRRAIADLEAPAGPQDEKSNDEKSKDDGGGERPV